MSRILTTSKLIESVRRRAMIPDDTAAFTDEDIIDIMNEELDEQVISDVLVTNEEHLVRRDEVDVEFSGKGELTMFEALDNLKENGVNRKTLRDLARIHVNGGVEDVTDLTLKLWNDVKSQTGEEMSSDTIRRTLSNYGKTTQPKPSERKLRELTSLSRLISSTIDAQKGDVPKKTGPQRDKPTAKEREQAKTLKDAMRENGIESGSQRHDNLATRLDAMKTRFRNRIEDLNRQIEAGLRDRRSQKVTPLDEEAMGLKAEVRRLDEELTDIERTSGALEARKRRTAIAARKKRLNQRIESLDRQIKAGKRDKRDVKTYPADAETRRLQDEVAKLEEVMDNVDRASGTLRDKREESMLRTLDTSINKMLKDIERGDVAPKKPKAGEATPYSKELSDKQRTAKMLRDEIR